MAKNKLYALLFSSLSIVACSSDDESLDKGALTVDKSELVFSNLGGHKLVYLTSSSSWKAVADVDWVEISPSGGTACKNLEVRISATSDEVDKGKTATITFSTLSGESIASIKVQRGELKPSRELDSLSLVKFYQATGGDDRWHEKWDLSQPMNKWGSNPEKTLVKLERVNGEVRVVEVFAQDNNLKGTLPEELQNLTELRSFAIEKNNVTTTDFPTYFTNMKSLELLNLADNAIKGELPSSVFDLPNLKYLVLHRNQMTGTVPTNIGNANKLITLSLFSNQLTGELPSSLSNLVNLERLWLSNNHFTGRFPSLDKMKKLFWLEIGMNAEFDSQTVSYEGIGTEEQKIYKRGGFSGPAPVFKDMPELSLVSLAANNFTESPVFENCPKVEQLFLENNNFKTLDASIFALSKLDYLRAYDCGIETLPEITGCGSLRYLLLHRNKISVLPASISKMTSLLEVLLYDNELTELPSEISALKRLQHIQINDNKLASLPNEFWQLTSLISMRLANNMIEGTLPETFVLHTQLANINFCNNKLTGSIDPLTTIALANELHFSNNQLNQDFPDNFNNCRMLRALKLDNNNITGVIKSSLGSCLNLQVLSLNNNLLTGSVPRTVHLHTNWSKWNPITNILPQQNDVTLSLQN
ncbi:MAG: leucine-rich repeat domain-containing protein [Marinifilaceae bacterium]